MDSALLQNLMAGAGSSSQFIGGLIVALLYVVIGSPTSTTKVQRILVA